MGVKSSKRKSQCEVYRKLRCEVCRMSASVFCLCSPHFVRLCNNCIPIHTGISHYTIVLERLEEFRQNWPSMPQQTLGPRRQQRNPAGGTAKKSHVPLVRIKDGSLCMWRLNRQWEETPLKYPIQMTAYAQFVWMETSLFCKGCVCYTERGNWEAGWPTVCEMERNGAVVMLPRMLLPIQKHALIWHSTTKQVLAFECILEMGTSPRASKCEALSWYSTRWEALPNAPPSFGIQACEFQQYIYLCGCYRTSTIEVFDPHSRTFLSPRRINLSRWTYLLVENNQLAILSNKHLEGILLCNQHPLVDSVNGLVYYVSDQGQVEFIKLDEPSSSFRSVNFFEG